MNGIDCTFITFLLAELADSTSGEGQERESWYDTKQSDGEVSVMLEL